MVQSQAHLSADNSFQDPDLSTLPVQRESQRMTLQLAGSVVPCCVVAHEGCRNMLLYGHQWHDGSIDLFLHYQNINKIGDVQESRSLQKFDNCI